MLINPTVTYPPRQIVSLDLTAVTSLLFGVHEFVISYGFKMKLKFHFVCVNIIIRLLINLTEWYFEQVMLLVFVY